MPVYQQPLWGYQITYPEGWIHETQGATEAFAARLEALDSAYQGPDAGQIVRLMQRRQRYEMLQAGHDLRRQPTVTESELGQPPRSPIEQSIHSPGR